MPDMLYVGLQDDNRIAVFAVDGDSGRLTRRADVAAAGGPSVTAISPDRNTLYVGRRVPDRTGRYMLCAYYQGGLCRGVSDRDERHHWRGCH